MKHVQACLSAKEDRKSSFHHCGGHVMLVQACLNAGKTCQRRFNLQGSAVKHVQACLSSIEERESNFPRCESAVSLVQACLYAGQPDNTVLTSEGVL